MMDETKVLWLLDFLGDKAREFVQVSDDVMRGERALQARDGQLLTEWQTAAVISAFINYVGEAERCRYGHFVCDLEKKNTEHRVSDAMGVLGRMELFWDHDDADDLTSDQLSAREELIDEFLANDAEIKLHLMKQPDMYQEGVPQETHREWSVRLRILGEKEVVFLKRWRELVDAQRGRASVAGCVVQSPDG